MAIAFGLLLSLIALFVICQAFYRQRIFRYFLNTLDKTIANSGISTESNPMGTGVLEDEYFQGYMRGLANVCSFFTTNSMHGSTYYLGNILANYFPGQDFGGAVMKFHEISRDAQSIFRQAEIKAEQEMNAQLKFTGLRFMFFWIIKPTGQQKESREPLPSLLISA